MGLTKCKVCDNYVKESGRTYCSRKCFRKDNRKALRIKYGKKSKHEYIDPWIPNTLNELIKD